MNHSAASLASAVCAAVLAMGAAACGNEDAQQKKLSYTEGPEETAVIGFVDAPPRTRLGEEGPEALSPGDVISFGEDLLDSAMKKVGALNGTCVVTRPGTFATAAAQCTATATVPGGTLALTFNTLAENVTGAITGGTGDYRGASGTFSDRHLAEDRPAVVTFNVTTTQK